MRLSVFVFLLAMSVNARVSSTQKLEREKKLGIPFAECAQIEGKIGQVLYVSVDGYAENNENAISPAYIRMVNDLQIGGVLPHPKGTSPQALLNAYTKLQKATTQPLLIGIDFHDLSPTGGLAFGQGFGTGFLGKFGRLPQECFQQGAFVDAFLHRALGINHALGPTIENTSDHKNGDPEFGNVKFLSSPPEVVIPRAREIVSNFETMGIPTTMKHFPYTPQSYNLHHRTEDMKLSPQIVEKKLRTFKDMSNQMDFAMTTHIYNSEIDPNDLATFSKKWVNILREKVGFKGILITDGLFMMDSYQASINLMSARWPQDQVPVRDTSSIFAARALLAGHDMVFLEATSRETYRVFNNLLRIACQNKPVSIELRQRINESYERIVRYKKEKGEALRQPISIPLKLIEQAKKFIAKESLTPKICLERRKKFEEFKKEVYALKITPLHAQGITPPPVNINNSSRITEPSQTFDKNSNVGTKSLKKE